MSEAKTTALRKPSRILAIIQIVFFIPLYAAALFFTTMLSFGVIFVFWDSDTIQNVQIERYWLHNFSAMPGVKGYASELLAHDALGLHPFIVLGEVVAFFMPFILLSLGVKCIRRRTVDLVLNPIFCWLYSAWLLLCVAIINKGLYP